MSSDKSICNGCLEFSILGGEISVPPLSASKIIFTFYNLQTYLMIKFYNICSNISGYYKYLPFLVFMMIEDS